MYSLLDQRSFHAAILKDDDILCIFRKLTMKTLPFLNKLHHCLIRILENSDSLTEVDELVSIAHSLAAAYLRRKIATRKFSPDRYGLSVEQFAYDAVAEVFERNDEGVFVRLHSYFDSFDSHHLSPEQLLAHFQTIVFSKVNDRIMEAAYEHDPAFGKILRNIRLSVHTVKNFEEREFLGEKILIPAITESNQQLPEIPDSEFSAIVRESVRHSKNIPQVLAKLCKMLCEQSEYSRIIPLMKLTQFVRDSYGESSSSEEVDDSIGQKFKEEESRTITDAICLQLQKEMYSKYVGRKKISSIMYDQYFAVIRHKLAERFVHPNGDMDTYFDLLKDQIPELTSAEYRKEHRAVLEYLAASANERIVKRLKKEYL